MVSNPNIPRRPERKLRQQDVPMGGLSPLPPDLIPRLFEILMQRNGAAHLRNNFQATTDEIRQEVMEFVAEGFEDLEVYKEYEGDPAKLRPKVTERDLVSKSNREDTGEYDGDKEDNGDELLDAGAGTGAGGTWALQLLEAVVVGVVAYMVYMLFSR